MSEICFYSLQMISKGFCSTKGRTCLGDRVIPAKNLKTYFNFVFIVTLFEENYELSFHIPNNGKYLLLLCGVLLYKLLFIFSIYSCMLIFIIWSWMVPRSPQLPKWRERRFSSSTAYHSYLMPLKYLHTLDVHALSHKSVKIFVQFYPCKYCTKALLTNLMK